MHFPIRLNDIRPAVANMRDCDAPIQQQNGSQGRTAPRRFVHNRPMRFLDAMINDFLNGFCGVAGWLASRCGKDLLEIWPAMERTANPLATSPCLCPPIPSATM